MMSLEATDFRTMPHPPLTLELWPVPVRGFILQVGLEVLVQRPGKLERPLVPAATIFKAPTGGENRVDKAPSGNLPSR